MLAVSAHCKVARARLMRERGGGERGGGGGWGERRRPEREAILGLLPLEVNHYKEIVRSFEKALGRT